MAKTIPPPTPAGGCVTYMGMTVCPHLVHLKPKQMKTVKKMHQRNIAELKRLKKKAAKGK